VESGNRIEQAKEDIQSNKREWVTYVMIWAERRRVLARKKKVGIESINIPN